MADHRSKCLIDRFADLPLVPMHEMCRHFNPCQLARVSLLNEKWMSMGGKKEEQKVFWISVCLEDNSVEFRFEDYWCSFCYSVRLSHSTDAPSTQYTPISLQCSFDSAEVFEKTSLRMLSVLLSQFPPSRYRHITVNLRSTSTEFPLRLLTRLPRGDAVCMSFSSEKDVNGEQLVRFLENVRTKSDKGDGMSTSATCHIDVRMDNAVKLDAFVISAEELKLKDARFLTRKSMETITFDEGEIGENNLTSEDFNVFFRRWLEDDPRERGDDSWETRTVHTAYRVSFEIGEHQKIDLEVVLEGMDASPWDPESRGRYEIDFDYSEVMYENKITQPVFIDFAEGIDFLSSAGRRGTVALIGRRLVFNRWFEAFPIAWYRSVMTRHLARLALRIEEEETERAETEEKIRNEGPSEHLEELLKENVEAIEWIQEFTQKAHECLRLAEQFED